MARQQVAGLAGDDDFLIRGYGPDLNPGSVGRDDGLAASLTVLDRVERDAEPAKIAEDAAPDAGRVLADAAGEDDRVGAAQLDEVGAEEVADRADEDVDREPGAGIAGFGRGLDVAEVAARAARALRGRTWWRGFRGSDRG